MKQDSGLKASLQSIVEDVKGKVREAREHGPRVGVQGLVENVTGKLKAVMDGLTGGRDDAARVGETKEAADQRRARESGQADVARASAAKQATKQRAKKA